MSVGRTVPRRMCVGCRMRAGKTELLRLAVVEGAVVPDPRERLPGRGASVHPDLRCLDLAERRRAFPRAFRIRESPDIGRLRDHLRAQAKQQDILETGEHRVGSRSRLQ